jgi:hypothetical protein
MQAPQSLVRKREELLEKSNSEADGGQLVGKDPRTISPEILSRYYGEKNPMKAIRQHCLDCCCGQAAEVRKCVSTGCRLWPLRTGTNPLRRKRRNSDKQKQLMSERLRRRRK